MALDSPRDVARLGIFVALIATLGFLRQIVLPIPNFELMSLGAFVGGRALGSVAGAAAAALAMGIYSGLNPLGPAPPPVFAAQIVGLAVFGACGGVLGVALARRPLLLGGVGLALTFVYDVLTNLGTAWVMGALRDPWPVLAGGLAFGAGHLAWNAGLFAIAGPPLLRAVERFERSK